MAKQTGMRGVSVLESLDLLLVLIGLFHLCIVNPLAEYHQYHTAYTILDYLLMLHIRLAYTLVEPIDLPSFLLNFCLHITMFDFDFIFYFVVGHYSKLANCCRLPFHFEWLQYSVQLDSYIHQKTF